MYHRPIVRWDDNGDRITARRGVQMQIPVVYHRPDYRYILDIYNGSADD